MLPAPTAPEHLQNPTKWNMGCCPYVPLSFLAIEWFGLQETIRAQRKMRNGRTYWRIFLAFALMLTGVAKAAQGANNPVPFIGSTSPVAMAPGGSPFTLTVHGAGFVPGSVVNWRLGSSNAPLATTFVTPTMLTASVPASAITTARTAWVTVSNPTPGGGISNVIYFPIRVAASFVSFTPATLPSTGIFPDYIVAGDFNGDGILDLAVANQCGNDPQCEPNGAGTVSIFLGNGDGTFTAAPPPPAIGKHPTSIAVGDFDRDGNLDLAVTTAWDNDVSILLGKGDGTFRLAPSFPTAGFAPWSVAVGDFNGDGYLDLAVSNWQDSVAVLLGNGDGTFSSVPVGSPTRNIYWWVSVGEFNQYGYLDLVVTNPDGTGSVLMGQDNGTFTPGFTWPAGGFAGVGDFNGDGNLDIAVGGVVFLGKGDGTFQPPITTPTGSATGDFNGDGKLDLATPGAVMLGNGDGTFQSGIGFPVAGSATDVAVGDFDGDGRLDLAVASFNGNYSVPGTVSVFLQSSSGGTISVTTNSAAATFTLTGPATLSGSGTSATFTNVPAGTYTISYGAVTCYLAPSGSSETLSAGGTLTFQGTYNPAPPFIAASPATLSFSYQSGAGASVPVQSLAITSACWAVPTSIQPPTVGWLSITQSTGTARSSATVAVAPGLPPKTYSAQIEVLAPGAANSPLYVPVTLSVTAGGLGGLAFPVKEDSTYCLGGTCTPYTANIVTAFDHEMQHAYEDAYEIVNGQCVEKPFIPPGYGTIIDFENERAALAPSTKGYGICNRLYGYTSSNQTTFLSNLNYLESPYLYYDSHPGYDYPFNFLTPVYPAISGCVSYQLSAAGATPAKYYHTLAIIPQSTNPAGGCEPVVNGSTTYATSETGYVVFYLHLASYPDSGNMVYCASPQNGSTTCLEKVACPNCPPEGTWVSVDSAQPIAYVGNFDRVWGGVGPHLHFEVDHEPQPSPTATSIPLDPYGWWSGAVDPYTTFTSMVNTWLWK
jgi:hypothetical protein